MAAYTLRFIDNLLEIRDPWGETGDYPRGTFNRRLAAVDQYAKAPRHVDDIGFLYRASVFFLLVREKSDAS